MKTGAQSTNNASELHLHNYEKLTHWLGARNVLLPTFPPAFHPVHLWRDAGGCGHRVPAASIRRRIPDGAQSQPDGLPPQPPFKLQ